MGNANLRLPLCSVQIACDGAVVKQGSTICFRCKDKQEKRNRKPLPLRGENTYSSGSERRDQERDKHGR